MNCYSDLDLLGILIIMILAGVVIGFRIAQIKFRQSKGGGKTR